MKKDREFYDALWNYGPRAKKAVPEIIRIQIETNYVHHMTLSYLLEKIGGKEALRDYLAAVADELNEGATVERQQKAAEMLVSFVMFDADAAINALFNAAYNNPNLAARNAAAFRLNQVYRTFRRNYIKDWPPDRFLELYLGLLNDKTGASRKYGAAGLGAMGEDGAPGILPLIEAIDDPNFGLCLCAVQALGEIGPVAKQANGKLVRLLNDERRQIRTLAAEALGKIAPPYETTVMALAEKLNDEDLVMRSYVIKALGNYGPAAKHATPGLIERLREKDERICEDAALALLKIGPDSRAIDNLVASLATNKFSTPILNCLSAIGPDGREAAAQVLRDIEVFYLWDPSTETLSVLPKLTKVQSLDISEADFSDEGMEHLGAVTSLRVLNLDRFSMSAAGAANLARLRNLEELRLARNSITDDNLKHIGTLTKLRRLLLTSSKVTDASIQHMAKLHNLETFENGTSITKDGETQLKKLLPSLKVGNRPND